MPLTSAFIAIPNIQVPLLPIYGALPILPHVRAISFYTNVYVVDSFIASGRDSNHSLKLSKQHTSSAMCIPLKVEAPAHKPSHAVLNLGCYQELLDVDLQRN
jgi:hypothetical protein